MSKQTQDLTSGPLGKQILLFSLPLMLSNVLQVLFNMSDIAVVGRFAGSEALGAVGSTSILIVMFTGLLIGMGGGINVIVARCLGMQKRKDTERSVHTALWISLATGIVVMCITLICARGFLCLLQTKEDLLAGATLYLRLYALGLPANALFNYGNAVFSAAGNTRKPLYFLSAAGTVNVALNLFFVICCGMNVDGVAIASVLSQYLSAILILLALFRSPDSYALRLRQLRPHRYWSRRILALGLPSGLQNSIFAFANLFVQVGINHFDTVTVEGNAAATNADALIFDVMTAFYTACSSFIGQNFGARKKDRMLKSYFISLAYSFGIAALMGGALVLFGQQFLSLFTTETAVVEAGLTRLRIMGATYAFSSFMDCTIAASRGIGKSVLPTVFVLLGSCAFRVLWVYTVFAHFGTIRSLYLLYICSWTLTAIAEILYFAYSFRRKTAILSA